MHTTPFNTINGTDEEVARYWALARKGHTSTNTTAEQSELRKLSRLIGGAYH